MTSFELATITQIIEKSCQSSMIRAMCMDNATDRGLVAEHIRGQVELAFASNVTHAAARKFHCMKERDEKEGKLELVPTPNTMPTHCRCGREFRPETFYVIDGVRKCFTCFRDHSKKNGIAVS